MTRQRTIETDNPRVRVLQYINPDSPYHGWWWIQAYRAHRPHVYLDVDGQWKDENDLLPETSGYYQDQEEAHAHLRQHPYTD